MSVHTCLEGAVRAVFRALGPGHSESVYQHAVAHELRTNFDMSVQTEVVVPILYTAAHVGSVRLDMVVSIPRPSPIFPETTFVIEFKTVQNVTPANLLQVQRYLDHFPSASSGFLVNIPPRIDDVCPEILHVLRD